MVVCRHFKVSGRVQAVGFRASACYEARRLGLTGWVRNLPDGDVEAFACGSAEGLEAFERWLWRGPRSARVTAVVATEAPFERLGEFDVR